MTRAVERSADAARRVYLERRAKLHLEAAIGALLDVMPIGRVAALLRENAQHLEDHG